MNCRPPFRLTLVNLIFVVIPSVAEASTFMTLASFNGANGSGPVNIGKLIADADGNLFGTTKLGGDLSLNDGKGFGTVFKVAAGTNSITTLASFDGTNGSDPYGGLVADRDGNLYGTTTLGGANNSGTVFKIEARTHDLTTLYSFSGGTDGSVPFSSLILDGLGNLYGTTTQGGIGNNGTVFKIASGTNNLTTLHSFSGGLDGGSPHSGLVLDGDGNLYGTAFQGGSNNIGTVFRIEAGTNQLTTLVDFDGSNGAYPTAALALDGDGNFYGTTANGGLSDNGTIFRIAAGTHQFSTLAEFNEFDGREPVGGLSIDASGNIYGTTYQGGATDDGTVFQVLAGTSVINPLYIFDGSGGSTPFSGVVAVGGKYYGTVFSGGEFGNGAIFEISMVVPELSSIFLSFICLIPVALACLKGLRSGA